MGFNDQQNKRISNWIIDELRLNPVSDEIPKKVVPGIQPTFEVNRKFCDIVRSGTSSATGTITAYTTPTDRDFYLSSVQVAYVKDASCDLATGTLNVAIVVSGSSQFIVRMPVITLTAQQEQVSYTLPIPVKLDRNSAITIAGTFSLGVMVRTLTITGYTQETGDVTPA